MFFMVHGESEVHLGRKPTLFFPPFKDLKLSNQSDQGGQTIQGVIKFDMIV